MELNHFSLLTVRNNSELTIEWKNDPLIDSEFYVII